MLEERILFKQVNLMKELIVRTRNNQQKILLELFGIEVKNVYFA